MLRHGLSRMRGPLLRHGLSRMSEPMLQLGLRISIASSQPKAYEYTPPQGYARGTASYIGRDRRLGLGLGVHSGVCLARERAKVSSLLLGLAPFVQAWSRG